MTNCAPAAPIEKRSLAQDRVLSGARRIALDDRAHLEIGVALPDKLVLALAAQRPHERGEAGHKCGKSGDQDGIERRHGRLQAEVTNNHIGTT